MRRLIIPGMLALALALFAYNVSRLVPMQGTDAAWRASSPAAV